MTNKKNTQEIMDLLNELIEANDDELDEVEMLCGCTGKSCESNWLSVY